MLQRIIIFMTPLLLAFPLAASAFQGYLQPFGEEGSISWGNGDINVVRALEATDDPSQRMSPIVLRKAASQARKQLLDIVMGVRIDARQTIGAFLAGDDVTAARVRGMIQNSPFERPALFDDGGEIRVSESLRGKLAELVLPATIQFQSGIAPKLSTSMEQALAFEGTDGLEAVGSSNVSYTGVIVDARGLKVTPALAPVIYGQDGVGVYGPFVVGRVNAITHGVAAYAETVDPVSLSERVGSRPLTVKAVSAYGSWRTDLVITSAMARLVRAAMRPGDIVDKCRVVIVIDPPVKPEAADDGEQAVKEQ